MRIKTLLITPPFTQLNTPYPATSYLSGFLKANDAPTVQCDLSIELFSRIFTRNVILEIFAEAEAQSNFKFKKVWKQRQEYINKVDMVIAYLREQEESTAKHFVSGSFLPVAHRSEKIAESYKNLDLIDKAKHLGTLFIEELGDFIMANVDEFFSFTRYAEQIARSASSFDQLDEFLNYEPTLIEEQLLILLEEKLIEQKPDLVGFSVPFPGNLFSALRCAQFIKHYDPKIKIAFGGGYCNTELRKLRDPRIFNYLDFISLDDGEGPLLRIIQYLSKEIGIDSLERTYILKDGKVHYQDKIPNTIFHHRNLPAPTYEGLQLESYLSFLDVINPMHRLWTDGRWNKLTVSHGCYWKQCSFCDVTLDYIGNYQMTTAVDLVNKIELLIEETGRTGFHFVDEAAPPKALKAIAQELLDRKLEIKWWTNIRFEKTFTPELCELLAKSGCIAVTGGLEVASDRLLAKMKKGVDIAQVARVTHAFSQNGIMTHAYLMYGFPTQTSQETIDSLEVVRQLFENKCIQSAFWHLFTATTHSPIGKDPESFGIEITGPEFHGFAENDLIHIDPTGASHDDFTTGLNTALDSYLNNINFDTPIQDWFDFYVEKTTVDPKLIYNEILERS
ncbi:MAG: radical SAM protein [Crocinitomicaceae bacterium]|nr:radical SAM protein [Crocinitomicaceae bacterium]